MISVTIEPAAEPLGTIEGLEITNALVDLSEHLDQRALEWRIVIELGTGTTYRRITARPAVDA